MNPKFLQKIAMGMKIGKAQNNAAQSTELESSLIDALDHIARVCQQSKQQSRRIRWIKLRADCALGRRPPDAWKTADLPANGESENMRLRRKIQDLEILLAKMRGY